RRRRPRCGTGACAAAAEAGLAPACARRRIQRRGDPRATLDRVVDAQPGRPGPAQRPARARSAARRAAVPRRRTQDRTRPGVRGAAPTLASDFRRAGAGGTRTVACARRAGAGGLDRRRLVNAALHADPALVLRDIHVPPPPPWWPPAPGWWLLGVLLLAVLLVLGWFAWRRRRRRHALQRIFDDAIAAA